MGIDNIWLKCNPDPTAIPLPGRDHGGPGWLVLERDVPLQLTQQNRCGCSPAESDIFHMSKENKICHCARQSEIFLKHRVPPWWLVFISSLDEHCN